MFYGAESFNSPISSWDVSSVLDMGVSSSLISSFYRFISFTVVSILMLTPFYYFILRVCLEVQHYSIEISHHGTFHQ